MDIVNIYGPLNNNAKVVLGVGNYNNIHGLLTYFPIEDELQMRPLPDVITPSVLELILSYEPDNKKYFSLQIKDSNQYIGVKIETDNNTHIAVASIRDVKTLFWMDYSSVDKVPREQILSGVLYSLQTSFGEQDYPVSWKIHGFTNGNLILIIPITWYEKNTDICEEKTGTMLLVERLNQLSFKGYTTESWCQDSSFVTHCNNGDECGKCLGPCSDPNHICYPEQNKYLCGTGEVKAITLNEAQSQGTIATWITLVSIVIIVALVTWARTKQERNNN